MSRPPPPANPYQTHCPKCERTFVDIWEYKRHQDDPEDPCNQPEDPDDEQ